MLKNDEVSRLNVNIIRKDNSEGNILEVDLDCQEKLHNLNDDYLTPKQIEIRKSILSGYFREIANLMYDFQQNYMKEKPSVICPYY